MMVKPRIQVDGDHATTASFFLRLDEDRAGAPYILVFGRYRDSVRRCTDGCWRFEERTVEIEVIQPRP